MPSPAPPQELLEEQQQHEQHRQEHEEGPARCASDEAGPIDVDEGEDEEEEDNADADADVNKQATTATAAAANDADDADADDADPNNDKDSASDPDLPRSILRKIIKARLSQVAATELGPGKEFGVSKEALEALGEGAKVFISFITSTANDLCKGAKRQTISAEDVANALSDSGFEEFAAPLRAQIEAKRSAAREAAAEKKREKEAEAEVALATTTTTEVAEAAAAAN